MLRKLRALKYASTFLKARQYCVEAKYLDAYKTLQKADKTILKDKTLVKFLLLEARVLYQLSELEKSKLLFVSSVGEIENAQSINLHEKVYLLFYIEQHFPGLLVIQRKEYNLNLVDPRLVDTFPLIDIN